MVHLFILILAVVVICAVTVWIIGQIGAPAIVPKMIWIFGVLVILWLLLSAVGLTGYDVPVPRAR